MAVAEAVALMAMETQALARARVAGQPEAALVAVAEREEAARARLEVAALKGGARRAAAPAAVRRAASRAAAMVVPGVAWAAWRVAGDGV